MDLLEQARNFVAKKIEDLPKPEATVVDVDLKGVGFDGLRLLAKVSVANPYGVAIPICEIAYTVKSAGRCVASGSIPDPGSLAANDKTGLDVAVKVPHSAVVSLIRDVGADWDVDYVLELGLIIDLPIVGNITIPVSYKGEMKLPTFSDMFGGKSAEEAAAEEVEKEKMKEKI
ncbi:desiccation protectant protein Lea14 homolog [Andrographis paniculata]|uniref:desiccation protectant protein Lea14 homolog n=1 Tax=Andrographis paniculata TaxID=175694 RepID=UPI0021E7F1F0|nr:desiccation protectant protein Lea14 homolog [Andrographis paniculata]